MGGWVMLFRSVHLISENKISGKGVFSMLSLYRWKALTIFIAFVLFLSSFELAAADQVLEVYNPAGVREDGASLDKLLKAVMSAVGMTRPPLAGEFPEAKVEKVIIAKDAFAEINELFYKRGWGDGLPIVPPTVERVREMLRGTDIPPDEVISIVPPKKGQATAEKIAVNAVMAGCRPEYMPVLIAAVEAIAEQEFNLSMVGTTTSNDCPLLIVSGPIARQLDINSGSNALGRGWRANASIGRALHMVINNIGGSWPGVNDMSTLGHPGEFANCLAEIEEGNPWGPLHAELGFSKESNVVTVVTAESYQAVVGLGLTSEQFLNRLSSRLVGLKSGYLPATLVILNYDTVDILNGDGWTRSRIKEYLAERAAPSASDDKMWSAKDGRQSAGAQGSAPKAADANGVAPVSSADQFLILVAGGPPGEKNMVVPFWPGSKPVSKEIKLPANWKELLPKETR
jgi:hypothetical protein